MQAHVIAADLSRHRAAAGIFAETERQGLAVDLLINNAGYGQGGRLCRASLRRPGRYGPPQCQHAGGADPPLPAGHAPAAAGRDHQRRLTAAFQPVPYMAVYGATKAFVLNFSEGLAEEVGRRWRGASWPSVPGATATGFWDTAGGLEGQTGHHATPDRVVACGAARL